MKCHENRTTALIAGRAPSNETKLHRDALKVLPALEITLTPASARLHGVRVNSVIEFADNCRVNVTRRL